ncbi:MAG: hypothetical protein AB1491_04665 [Thermodesulfobacteriota bacterium]
MANYLVAIPTYWTYPAGRGAEEVIYDHPSPLDTPGTLRRTLESLTPLIREKVRVAVVAGASASGLEGEVEGRVREIIATPPLPYPVLLLAASHRQALQDFFRRQGKTEWLPWLSPAGYSQMRNLTLILATIWEAEILVSLDDDEVIDDGDFLIKIEEDFALLSREHPICGLAGIYRQADGGVLLPEPAGAWAAYWPKLKWMNAAFRELILTGPRLKPTPLGFGGNLALSAPLFRRLPFDPALTRGEDTDYILNARMFQIPFFLDNTLGILHLPPKKPHPTWLRLRQDLIRFAYTRVKLRQQEAAPGLARVAPEELKPYPGNFLDDNLESLALRSHALLSLEYLDAGDAEGARQTLENLLLLDRITRSDKNVFQAYLGLAAQWQDLQTWLAYPPVAAQARQAVWGTA